MTGMRLAEAAMLLTTAASTAAPAAAAPPRMVGFAALAGGERIDIVGIPAWQSGSFRVGSDGTRGHVRRRAVGTTDTRDGAGAAGGNRRIDHVTRRGSLSFTVTGPTVGGTLTAECRYDRGEVRLREGAVDTAMPTLPLRYACTFAERGRPLGDLLLDARPEEVGAGKLPVVAAGRAGRIVLGGVALDLRSVHRLEGRRWPIERPVGYLLADADRPVAAVDLNGGSRAALALPRDAAERRAAIAAGLALALFWDPGDTDD